MGLGDLLETAAKRTIGVTDTFNAAALLGLQAGGVEDRIANATEVTAKNTKRLVDKANQGGLAFS